MGLHTLVFEDDWDAWVYLRDRGYTMIKGVIHYRPEKLHNMPKDEMDAINYLVFDWDWSYE